MSDKIVGIIGPGGEGGTFLDWSLHYLSGEDSHHCILVDRNTHTILGRFKHLLVDNPVTEEGNAHLHLKTHPTEKTIDQCRNIFIRIKDSTSKLKTMYIVPSKDLYEAGNSYRDFVKNAVNQFTELNFIQFYHPDEMLTDLVHRVHTKIPNINQDIELISEYVFASCNEDSNDKIIDLPNVYSLNIKQMFYELDSEIHKIFLWLDISIDQNRYLNWINVYKQWQLAQNFCTST